MCIAYAAYKSWVAPVTIEISVTLSPHIANSFGTRLDNGMHEDSYSTYGSPWLSIIYAGFLLVEGLAGCGRVRLLDGQPFSRGRSTNPLYDSNVIKRHPRRVKRSELSKLLPRYTMLNMVTLMGKLVKGGAAIAVSPEGDIRLVFNLDRSWIVSTTSTNKDLMSCSRILDRGPTTYPLRSHSQRTQV